METITCGWKGAAYHHSKVLQELNSYIEWLRTAAARLVVMF